MLKADLLIFDLDGTLVDSKDDIAFALNATFGQFGVMPLPLQVIAAHVGTGVMPLIEAHIPPSQLALAQQEFSDRYLNCVADRTQVMNGMLDVLHHYAKKLKVVLTSKRERFTKPILQKLKLDSHFGGVYSRESFPEIKPSPVPILGLCEIWKIKPVRTLMIGDTVADIQAGKAAGALTCAYLSGYGVPEELIALKPDLCVRDAKELVGRIE